MSTRVVTLVVVLVGTWSLGETAHLNVKVGISLVWVHRDFVSGIIIIVNDEMSVIVGSIVSITPHFLAQLDILMLSDWLDSDWSELILVL
jgi:hypothetical protein